MVNAMWRGAPHLLVAGTGVAYALMDMTTGAGNHVFGGSPEGGSATLIFSSLYFLQRDIDQIVDRARKPIRDLPAEEPAARDDSRVWLSKRGRWRRRGRHDGDDDPRAGG